jgi:hypothetical protein
MSWSLRRLTPSSLILASLGYWAGLAVVRLGPAIAAIWRATHAPDGTSSVSLNFGNGGISLVVSIVGQSTWTGSIHLVTLALLIAVPPLAMWFGWLAARGRSAEAVATASR